VLTQRWQRGNVRNTNPYFTAILRKIAPCPEKKNSLPREQLLPLMLTIPTINARKTLPPQPKTLPENRPKPPAKSQKKAQILPKCDKHINIKSPTSLSTISI
jgi:hypothetical protein